MISWCDVMNPNEENEPIIRTCEICDFEDEIEYMVDCPKYSEELRKGIIPGWIHEKCCEEDFEKDPRECIEGCDNDSLSQNIKKHFKNCVDLEGLSEKEMRGMHACIGTHSL